MYEHFKHVLVEKRGKVILVKFNNPSKKNCVNWRVYEELGQLLRIVSSDENVTVVVITGEGEYFTAGNDLTQSSEFKDFDSYMRSVNGIFIEMISAIIDCPKLLIALVNGPSIGIGTTLAALCDLTWVAEGAYFLTPFSKLGIVPEACSTFLFPLIVGRSKATEMLLLNEKMTADEAYGFKLASKVFKLSEMDTQIWPKIKEYSELPQGALIAAKQLIRMHEKDSLYKALYAEGKVLQERFRTDEFFNALMSFSTRKSKSKL